MTIPEARQEELVGKFGVIEDLQERLQCLVARKPSVPSLPEEQRRPELLVSGCSSPVWLQGEVRGGVLHLAMFSASPLVYSLAGIVCDLCHDALAQEVEKFEPGWIESLGLERYLSATRQRGMDSIHRAIREIVQSA